MQELKDNLHILMRDFSSCEQNIIDSVKHTLLTHLVKEDNRHLTTIILHKPPFLLQDAIVVNVQLSRTMSETDSIFRTYGIQVIVDNNGVHVI